MHPDELVKRFWPKVDRSGGPDACWTWQAHRDPNGYGKFGVRRRMRGAHRFAWEATHGPIAAGLFVLHGCDNRPCVNPAHLSLGTNKDNVRDMWSKGRNGSHRPAPARGEASPHAILDSDAVRAIRHARSEGATISGLARSHRVAVATVADIIHGRSWAHVA